MEVLQNINGLLDNQTTVVVVSLVLAMYSGLAAPALPNSVILFFDSLLGKLLFIFLIGYLSSRNIQVALMVAVAYLVTLHVLNKRSAEQFSVMKRESFLDLPELNNDEMDTEETEVETDAVVDPVMGVGSDMDMDAALANEDGQEAVLEGVEGVDEDEEMVDEQFTGKYNVKPANNLSGNSSAMYAPVKF
tara:strand:- start:748 stop:1317 length:570 start_codon:yes stop_codon:yes gene_type:complete